MSLTTPSKIRELQIKLYRKAKNEPEFRFYQLYDKVYREDILSHAYALAKANNGAPGVEGESFQDIESGGRGEGMNGLREDLRNKTYRPQRLRNWSWSRSGKRSWSRMLTAIVGQATVRAYAWAVALHTAAEKCAGGN